MKILRKFGLVTVKELNCELEAIELRMISSQSKKNIEYRNKLAKVIRDYEEHEARLTDKIARQNEIISTLNEELKKAEESRGGLTKENNSLKKEIEELKRQLEDSMSDKYLVKKVRSGRTPNTQKMKVHHTGVESRIIKRMKGDISE